MLGIGGEGAAEWLQLPGEVLAGLVGLVLKHRTAEVPVELDVAVVGRGQAGDEHLEARAIGGHPR